MARLHIMNLDEERRVEIVLSRRNLLALLHKLDMPGSARTLTNGDCWEDGRQTPSSPEEQETSDLPPTVLVLRSEDDAEHYGKREYGPGVMHSATEAFVQAVGGSDGGILATKPESS